MTDQETSQGALKVRALNNQVFATLQAADRADNIDAITLRAAADTVTLAARREEWKLSQGPVLQLPANASDKELRNARLRRSVRRGEKLYLPSWRDMAIGLPNVLVRSAVFAATNPGKALFDAPIATQGDTTLKMTGPQLGHYDRQVFAACLRHYKEELTLYAANTAFGWAKVSFWQMAKDLNVPYGLNGHIAIRESLIRLNAAHLRIRVKTKDIPLPRLIEVAFDDGYESRCSMSNNIKGSDIIAFRILDAMADLFGPDDWSNVSDCAIFESSGLQSWIATFYSTHAKAFPLNISDLHRYSGVTCELREFRRLLKETMVKLQSKEIDAQVRIEKFELCKKFVTVHLVRWNKKLV